MNVLVDTNLWIDLLKKKLQLHHTVEEALKNGRVYTTPLIFSELLSGTHSDKQEQQALSLLVSLNLTEPDLEHWKGVGRLRRKLREKGFSVSIPDAHLMQSCHDIPAVLVSHDKIFKTTRKFTKIEIL